MVIEIHEIEPGFDVFALLREFADIFGKKLQRLDIAARTAPVHETAPLIDFPGRVFMLRVGLDPFEDFAVAFAGGELLAQSREIEAQEVLEMLVDRSVIGELTIRPRNCGPPFIEQACESDIPPDSATWAAWSSFRQV